MCILFCGEGGGMEKKPKKKEHIPEKKTH